MSGQAHTRACIHWGVCPPSSLPIQAWLAAVDCVGSVAVMVMSPESRALCYFYRNPPPGSDRAPLKWTAIASLVWNKDGETHPTPSAVRKCVLGWQRERLGCGRKKGTRKTTTREDKVIKQCFHKARHHFWFQRLHRAMSRIEFLVFCGRRSA